MKLSKKKEKEIIQVYEAYWVEYLKGNVDAMQALLDVSYTQVGSAESEVLSSKKEAVQFLVNTIDQVAGKLEMRNRSTKLEQQDHLVLIHELCDLYAMADKKWVFYSKFRVSTLLQEKKESWKIIHQHSSFPDTKTEEGQNVAIEKIAEENKELREAVKRRTVELEQKNRELQIEAALERVRARTMAMQKSEELQDAALLLFQQVEGLGLPPFACGFNIWDADMKAATAWMGSVGGIQPPFKTDSSKDIYLPFYLAAQRGESLYVIEQAGKELETHYAYLSTIPTFRDIILENFKREGISLPTFQIIHCAFFSQGYLMFISYKPVTAYYEIFKRFAKVFEQTYTRFLDLKKAEAQAREALIEAALERVRSRSMAMHKSEELNEVVKVIFDQMAHLKINAEHAGIVVDYEPKKDFHFWVADNQDIPAKITVPYLDLVWDRQFTEAKKKDKDFFTTQLDFEEKNSFYKKLLPHIENLTKQAQDFYLNCPGLAASTVIQKDIGLYIENFSGIPFSNEDNSILMRFGKVFQQTYTRFLDLQKAEAQAQEAQIQLALERVRARTMAMHNSEELGDISFELFKQVQALGVATWHCAFNIYHKDQNSSTEWGTNAQGTFPKYKIPREGIFLRYYEIGQTKETFHIEVIGEDKCADHYKWLCTLPEVGEQLLNLRDSGVSFPTSQIDHVAYFKYGYLLFITYEPVTEAHDIFMRFAKVFEQTYTRFLDLQKAEAQTRESQIEAAMERIRSRAIAMRTSNELLEVALEIRIQTDLLGQQDLELSVVHLYEKDAEYFESLAAMRTPGSEGEITTHKMKFPVDATPEIQQMMKNYWAGLSQYTIELNLKQREAWQKVLETTVPDLFDQRLQFDEIEIAAEKKEYWNFADFSGGSLLTVTYSPPTTETKELFRRAADVFDLAYKRFKDLKKAEAQAREAQIEAALERVRGRALAMHKSEELLAVIEVVSEQLLLLDLNFDTVSFGKNNQAGDFKFWLTSSGQPKPVLIDVPFLDSQILKSVIRAQKNGKDFIEDVFTSEENKAWSEHLLKFSDLKLFPEHVKQFILTSPGFARSSFLMKHIDLYIGNYRAKPFTDEENSIFRRFAHVFEQSYTRFLDLQKAEAQAREALIENALEKVRSRSLAMHKPDELQEVITVVAEKLQELGVIFDVGGVILCTYFPNNKDVMHWIAAPGFSSLQSYLVPYFDNPIFNDTWDSKNRGDEYFSKEFPVEAKNSFFEYAFEHSDYKHFPDDYKQHVLQAEKHILTAAWSKNSAIIIPSLTGVVPSESDAEIMKRFAKVLEQAYIRFMDLQKAEAQARESQIEAALEKVRSRTMAMQQSNELPEAANDLFLQVQALGIPAWSAGYCIWESKDKKAASCNMSSEGEIQKAFILPTIGEGYNFYDPLQKGEAFYVEELGGDALVKHYDFIRTLPMMGEILDELIASGLSLPTFQIFHIVYFPQGYLMFITYEPVPDAHVIFKRFAKVFEQTYTRFLDLKKAEAQAREATKQTSLDRVRGQIASMRSTADLNRITPLVWNELTTMGVPFIRCGVFIIDEPTKTVQVYLSAPDGHSLGVLHLQFNANPLTANTVAYWQKGRIFKEHWNREEFISWTQSLMEEGQISDKNAYQDQTNPPESLNLHFIPFTQGMLYVGSENSLNNEQIELVQSLADAFAIAYARYEDFTKLEKAKKSVETTLSELKTTQNQLVQSEKMASLGELTAGIAHEIQNPLNFVNNFSEVSNELIDEMNEEIEKGDMEEAKAIADDIKQNLTKINHHGKRADAIVKGMLQHSRSSSGSKEPTDINALADEYLRLAYHGLRAKDKSFNATIKTDFQENIGNINIIPQDIGRVVLNLITNAFYATNEKTSSAKASGDTKYEPTVSVSTKHTGNQVLISVKDNGNGIPKKVLDKIFQPFFTTKPTGQGTGLGLSMSYDIVTKGHTGELKVETKKGEGAEFVIHLPSNN